MNDQERLLTIFLRLQAGAHLTKSQLADEFGLDPKTIQRDFSRLSDFMATLPMIAGELAYDAKHHTRYLKGKSLFNKKDILIITKILLENRALNKEENKGLLDSLLALIAKEERQEVQAIIASELLNYAPLSDEQDRIDKVWEWSQAIYKEQVMAMSYQSPYRDRPKTHTIFPVSLYYDSHYFYLVAYHLLHQTYTTFKLDRILSWSLSDDTKPALSYGKKFRDGDVRNYHVDAFLGPSLTMTLTFRADPTIVFDQFPDARVLSLENGRATLEVRTQDTPGLKRWLLSQGPALKVLSPQSLVDELKVMIEDMKNLYD